MPYPLLSAEIVNVISATTTTPPGSPSAGDLYAVPAGSSGAWGSGGPYGDLAGRVVQASSGGGWFPVFGLARNRPTDLEFYQQLVKATDNGKLYFSDGTGWAEYSAITGTESALNPPFTTLTDGATVTWALANVRVNNARVTLGGNRTLSITGAVDGASGLLIVIQDGTGSRTLSLPAGSKVLGGGAGAISLSSTAGAKDILSFYYDGTSFFWTYGKNFT